MMTRAQLKAKDLLQEYTGLDDSEHSQDTPKRFLEMLSELTSHRVGLCDAKCMKFKTFDNEGMDEMIVVQGITFVSVCNHHVIPFMGVAHIAYVPDKLIAGLSKFARVVDHFSRTLQVQERLTAQVADFLEEQLKPRGVAVIMQAEHLCMTVRGVHKPGAKTTTATMKGVFADHTRTAKAEFMQYLQNGGKH
jgi:GTP cyclohydrolase I